LHKQKAQQAHSRNVDWVKTLVQKGVDPQRGGRGWQPQDLVYRRHAPKAETLHCLVLDCSGSMLAHHNLSLAKGLLLQWVEGFYQRRDRLVVLGFNGQKVQLLQPARKAVAFNEDWISAIKGGGGTPATLGLGKADEILQQAKRKQPGLRTGLWLLTDGRFNPLPSRPEYADQCTVVDFENRAVPLRRAQQIAQLWQSDYFVAAEFYETP